MPRTARSQLCRQGHAFNAGYERVKDLQYEVIGNLDADISFDADHLRVSCSEVRGGSQLWGCRNGFQGRRLQFGNRQFRRAESCFWAMPVVSPDNALRKLAAISTPGRGNRLDRGDHRPHDGLEDAIISREVLLPLPAFGDGRAQYSSPHRSPTERKTTTSADTRSGNSSGLPIGSTKQPYLLGGMALGLGYCLGFLRRTPRPVSHELMRFHRKEQMLKLKAILKSRAEIQDGSIISMSSRTNPSVTPAGSYERNTSVEKSSSGCQPVCRMARSLTERPPTITRVISRVIWGEAQRLSIIESPCWEHSPCHP